MSNLIETIKADILTAIESDKLLLPTLPEVAIRVRELAESDDASINDLVKVINNDAALSARLVRVCNSPLFRGSREVQNLNMAVSRLGMAYTSNLAMGLAMEQMFQATSEIIDKKLRAVWQKNTEIAGICHVLAQHYTKLKPDQATLGGLVHQIGALPILRYLEDHDLQVDAPTLDAIIAQLHPKIGTKILIKWDFPVELQNIPEAYLQFDRQVPSVDYADVVQVANLQSLIGTNHPLTQMDWNTVSAFARLGLDPDVDEGAGEDLTAAMDAAMSMLK